MALNCRNGPLAMVQEGPSAQSDTTAAVSLHMDGLALVCVLWQATRLLLQANKCLSTPPVAPPEYEELLRVADLLAQGLERADEAADYSCLVYLLRICTKILRSSAAICRRSTSAGDSQNFAILTAILFWKANGLVLAIRQEEPQHKSCRSNRELQRLRWPGAHLQKARSAGFAEMLR
jgi:hypothetical protein